MGDYTSRMNLQQRYEDISKRSGFSEDVVRRVLKASRESLAYSLKHGEGATLPGIVKMVPELKEKIVDYSLMNCAESGVKTVRYIKVKACASSALETELDKLGNYEERQVDMDSPIGEFDETSKLWIVDGNKKEEGVITNQISALL